MLGSNMGLNGTLPASWSSLTTLQKVHVDQTSIKGELWRWQRPRVDGRLFNNLPEKHRNSRI